MLPPLPLFLFHYQATEVQESATEDGLECVHTNINCMMHLANLIQFCLIIRKMHKPVYLGGFD